MNRALLPRRWLAPIRRYFSKGGEPGGLRRLLNILRSQRCPRIRCARNESFTIVPVTYTLNLTYQLYFFKHAFAALCVISKPATYMYIYIYIFTYHFPLLLRHPVMRFTSIARFTSRAIRTFVTIFIKSVVTWNRRRLWLRMVTGVSRNHVHYRSCEFFTPVVWHTIGRWRDLAGYMEVTLLL